MPRRVKTFNKLPKRAFASQPKFNDKNIQYKTMIQMKISSVVIGNPLSELKARKSGGQFKKTVLNSFLEPNFSFVNKNLEKKKILW